MHLSPLIAVTIVRLTISLVASVAYSNFRSKCERTIITSGPNVENEFIEALKEAFNIPKDVRALEQVREIYRAQYSAKSRKRPNHTFNLKSDANDFAASPKAMTKAIDRGETRHIIPGCVADPNARVHILTPPIDGQDQAWRKRWLGLDFEVRVHQ